MQTLTLEKIHLTVLSDLISRFDYSNAETEAARAWLRDNVARLCDLEDGLEAAKPVDTVAADTMPTPGDVMAADRASRVAHGSPVRKDHAGEFETIRDIADSVYRSPLHPRAAQRLAVCIERLINILHPEGAPE